MTISGRRALTESEEEDRRAEEEADEEEEESAPQITMDEYLAKQTKSAAIRELNSALRERKAGEGNSLRIGPKDKGEDLEVRLSLQLPSTTQIDLLTQAAASSHFKNEVSFSPALTAAAMSWQTINESNPEHGRTFHAACVITLPNVRLDFLLLSVDCDRSESEYRRDLS